MMFLKLPIKFLDENSDEYVNYKKMADLLGDEGDPPLIDGFIHVNSNSITSFHESSDGNLVISLNNGRMYDVFISYEEFLKDFTHLEEELNDGEENSTSN